MEYTRNAPVSGTWIKGSDVKSGVRAKLLSETVRTESQFKNEDGTAKMQDVSKVRFEDKNEIFNIAINRATLQGLIEAFGTESKNWMNKYLTAQTEKMIVGGKKVTALYLIPEGFELGEDDGGYMVVRPLKKEVAAEKEVEYPEADIDPEDIPF